MHNKFSTNPNVYKFHLKDEYIGIYDGMDDQFWKGYNAPPEKNIICFIEAALEHKAKKHNNFYDKAYVLPHEIENYVNNDKIFKYSGVHPNNEIVFDLKLVGGQPKLKPIGI